MESFIATVNSNDQILDSKPKTEVHRKGLLHRAFSIFVFNSRGEVLLHQRSIGKYHSPGLWTNTCCSHLPENLSMEETIHQRLEEEMGFDTELNFVGKFHYQVNFDNGLAENEIDHIYIGFYNNNPKPNPTEVASYKWVLLNDLIQDVEQNPNNYTYWLKHILENYISLLSVR